MPKDPSDAEEWEEDDWPDSFSDIPAADWDMHGINWLTSSLENWDKRYIGAIVETFEIMSLFPQPEISSATLEGRLYGFTFITDAKDVEYSPPELAVTKRGAPHRTETILERAIHEHLDKLLKEGALASKKEAQIAEISDFVKATLGQTLPRSTAQRILTRWAKKTCAHKKAHK